jgi:Zn2+/Cd2+-exporting ATPase
MKTENAALNTSPEPACCDHDHPAEPGKKHQQGEHSHEDHSHDDHGDGNWFTERWPLWASLLILVLFLTATWGLGLTINRYIELALMLTAYLLAGHKTIALAGRKISHGDFFNEFTLMTIATFGAFYIGEFSEGVAVMVFYEMGELFQDLAVNRSKRSIRALLDLRPETVQVIHDGVPQLVKPSDVKVGERILVKNGEKVALDGTLVSATGTFNTAALTGESRPDRKNQNEIVLAGMINTDGPVEVQVTSLFKDSKLSRILEMVQDATTRKAPTQLLISRLAKVYTPIVFSLALLVIFSPLLFVSPYHFDQWLYRGMVFLVVACPCALTISIPLGYFGGIGLASRNGILVKGSNFLDALTKINIVVTDKTGTLTKGVFNVQKIASKIDEKSFLKILASLESYSTHPVAKAIVSHAADIALFTPQEVSEIPGFGLSGQVNGAKIVAGNLKLLEKMEISYPQDLKDIAETIVAVAISDVFEGYVILADELKEDTVSAINALKKMNIETVMLSGDKTAVTKSVALQVGIARAYGDLLPEDKVALVEKLKAEGNRIAFVGDGINDAPVVALSDVGFAMGGLGSDATIETADVVIQNDQPSKIVSAIRVGHLTRKIVIQNISFAIGIKILVMALGAGGMATLWEAVFADVGVALLAILNALRIQGKKV